MDEYKAINDTLAKIVEAENRIKAEQIENLKLQLQSEHQHHIPNSGGGSEQKMVPAAMRTSIMFGVSQNKFINFLQ